MNEKQDEFSILEKEKLKGRDSNNLIYLLSVVNLRFLSRRNHPTSIALCSAFVSISITDITSPAVRYSEVLTNRMMITCS